MRILLSGGSGLLARNLKIQADRPTHKQLDITKPIKPKDYDLIVHSAAYTDTTKAENECRFLCFKTNVWGTLNLLHAYPQIPFVFISTEYASNPVNFYSQTKKMAEDLVKLHSHYLIIRTLFKSKPWKYDYAFEDVYTEGGYVEDVAPLIDKAIMEWDGENKTIYVGDGRGRKSMLSLARETKPDVKANSLKDKKGVILSK